MNIKFVPILSGVILAANIGVADADAIYLTSAQMDSVTAGGDYGFSQSSSFSQIAQNDAAIYYNLGASSQGDSAVANATVSFDSNGFPPPPTAFSFPALEASATYLAYPQPSF